MKHAEKFNLSITPAQRTPCLYDFVNEKTLQKEKQKYYGCCSQPFELIIVTSNLLYIYAPQ
jgi:hypothetical protein